MAVKDDSWTVTTLKECARWYSGGTPNTSIAEYWNGDIPWITASSLHDFYIKNSERRVTPLGIANGTRLIPKDTILFIVRGMSLKTEFRVGITRRPMAFGQDCKALVAKDGVDPLFLANVLRAKSEEILGFVDEASHGTGRLATDALEKLEILFPPLAEQKAIAHILGTLDDKIELNQQMNQTLEAIARALFKSWFIDFDPVRAKLDGRQPAGMDAETAALFPAEFEDGGAIGKIPKGWKIQDLSDLAKILSGKRPSERSPEPTAEMPIPLFGGGGVMAYVKDPLYREPILLTGRVGTLGLVFRIAKPCWTSDNTLIILPKQTFNYEFLYFQLREIRFESLNRGSTQPLVTQGDLTKQQFVVSDALLLQAFHQITSLLYKRFEINSDETESLTSIRDALLPKLLSGEIRVQDAETVVERVV